MNTEQLICDFHIHSRFARGCSRQITLQKLEEYARIKGLHVLGTGDFTHPTWFQEVKEHLKEDEHGILWSTTGFPFIWQVEVSLMYTQGGKGRRVHHGILAPNTEVASQIRDALGKKGRLDYDGRPIFGFSSIELIDMMRDISHDIEIIPYHMWTSWFAIFGSKSGFDSVEECFEDRAKYIHVLETGMSSTPAMNWRVSSLDRYNFVSFSDNHSYWPWRMGREATIFNCGLTYKNILHALRTGEHLASTIETYPEYGKYHFDGHRNCDVFLHPPESKKLGCVCPKCKRELTIGVAYRVEELADREPGYVRKGAPSFTCALPLTELIAAVYGVTILTGKKVWATYNKLIQAFGNEYTVLFDVPFEDLLKHIPEQLARVILKNRDGTLALKPGYDGVYGEVILDTTETFSPPRTNKKTLDTF